MTQLECQSLEKRQRHLLCVDDEENRVLLTASILRIYGYRVTALISPFKATKIFGQEDIELAVLDYQDAENERRQARREPEENTL